MLEDKLRATDWEATNEAMEEAVARESYLNWLQDSERRARGAQPTVSLMWITLISKAFLFGILTNIIHKLLAFLKLFYYNH